MKKDDFIEKAAPYIFLSIGFGAIISIAAWGTETWIRVALAIVAIMALIAGLQEFFEEWLK